MHAENSSTIWRSPPEDKNRLRVWTRSRGIPTARARWARIVLLVGHGTRTRRSRRRRGVAADGDLVAQPGISSARGQLLSKAAVELYMSLSTKDREEPPDPAAWTELRHAGFVAGGLDEPVLLDPAIAARGIERRLLTEWAALNEEIDLLHRAFESMRAAYERSEWSATGDRESIETIVGAEAIDAALEDAFQQCTQEVRTAQTGSGASHQWLDRARHHERLLERGIRTRMLFQHVARFHVPIRSHVARVTALGSQVRTLDEFFEQLTVVDDAVAFLPAGERRDDIVAIRHPAIVRFLVDVFDRAWTRGLPFSPTQDTRVLKQAVDGTRLAVMRLVIEGSTDEAGARRVGLSLRNYREHVRALMAQSGARTRAQLGYRIGASGLAL